MHIKEIINKAEGKMKYPTNEELRDTNPVILMLRHWGVFGYWGHLKMWMSRSEEALEALNTLLLAALHILFFPLMPIIAPTIKHIKAKRYYAYTEKLRKEYRK